MATNETKAIVKMNEPKAKATPKKVTLYTMLGVEPTATTAEIKKAYHKLSMTCHPDRHPNNEALAERFKEISVAQAILTDKGRRRKYDASLVGGGVSHAAAGGAAGAAGGGFDLAAVVLSFFGRSPEAFFGEFFSKGFEGFAAFPGSKSVTTHYTKPDGTTGTHTRTVLKLGKPADGHHERTKCKFGIDCREIRAGRRCSDFHTKEELAAARQYVANAKAAAVAAAKPDAAAKTKLAPKRETVAAKPEGEAIADQTTARWIKVFSSWLDSLKDETVLETFESCMLAFVKDAKVSETIKKEVSGIFDNDPQNQLTHFHKKYLSKLSK
jgi:curved DNA-binding protein CbpA